MGSEILNPALTPFLQDRLPLLGGANVHTARVRGVGGDLDEPVTRESGHDAAHRGRLDLLGGGQFAERLRASEDEHGERREPCGALASSDVLFA